MTDYTNVSARAMLVALRLSVWSARKFDKKATHQVHAANSADENAGRYNKHLFAGAASHAAALAAGESAREVHYAQTLPWADEGWRLLPTANYMAYTAAMRKARGVFDTNVAAFIAEYPALQAQAQAKLGALFSSADFPSTVDARSRFNFRTEFAPVPRMDGDVRLALPQDAADAIEQEVTSRVEASARDAMLGAWERLHEAVSRIHKATGPDGVVRPTLLEHARDVCDVLARLNVGGDAQLEALRVRTLQELVAPVPDVEALKKGKDETLRESTQRKAAEIMAAMGQHYAPPVKKAVA